MRATNLAMLTIIMPTYNKKAYISDALDSIFMQKTKYSYEIIIADDCSNDGTLDIVRAYQMQYPNKINLLESTYNQKLFKNVLRAYAITKTDYFCVLDPDDFWIDEQKIEKALDFLEANKDFTIYAANTHMHYNDKDSEVMIGCKQEKISDFQDYLQDKAVLGHTSSCIFRNVIFKEGLPSKLTTLSSPSNEVSYRGDSFRNLLHIHKGKAVFMPYVDSVYRITDEGIWQSLNENKQMMMNCMFFKDMWLFFEQKYPTLLSFSYRFYQKLLQPQSIETILSEKHDNFIVSMDKLYELHSIYQPYKTQLQENSFKKPTTLKYKILFSCYTYLYKKLTKKGFL